MRPALVCLVVLPNVGAILVVVAVAIIVFAVIVSMVLVTVALITAVAIVVVVVLIPPPMLMVVTAVIGVTSTIIDVHRLHSLHYGLHLLKPLLLGSIGGSHGFGHLGVEIWRRRRCVN